MVNQERGAGRADLAEIPKVEGVVIQRKRGPFGVDPGIRPNDNSRRAAAAFDAADGKRAFGRSDFAAKIDVVATAADDCTSVSDRGVDAVELENKIPRSCGHRRAARRAALSEKMKRHRALRSLALLFRLRAKVAQPLER